MHKVYDNLKKHLNNKKVNEGKRERYLHLDEIVRVTIEVIAYTFNFLYYRQIIMPRTFIAKTDLFKSFSM